MTDRETWDNAVLVVRGEYGELSDEVRATLSELTTALRVEKRELHSLTASQGAENCCAECGGACCKTGKYHFSVIDLLAFLPGGGKIPNPSFNDNCCPYMGKDGCQMEPSFRPFTCITFHCEELDALLTPQAAARLSRLEEGLRTRCRDIEKLFDKPLMKSLLLAYERYLREPGSGLISART